MGLTPMVGIPSARGVERSGCRKRANAGVGTNNEKRDTPLHGPVREEKIFRMQSLKHWDLNKGAPAKNVSKPKENEVLE